LKKLKTEKKLRWGGENVGVGSLAGIEVEESRSAGSRKEAIGQEKSLQDLKNRKTKAFRGC